MTQISDAPFDVNHRFTTDELDTLSDPMIRAIAHDRGYLDVVEMTSKRALRGAFRRAQAGDVNLNLPEDE